MWEAQRWPGTGDNPAGYSLSFTAGVKRYLSTAGGRACPSDAAFSASSKASATACMASQSVMLCSCDTDVPQASDCARHQGAVAFHDVSPVLSPDVSQFQHVRPQLPAHPTAIHMCCLRSHPVGTVLTSSVASLCCSAATCDEVPPAPTMAYHRDVRQVGGR